MFAERYLSANKCDKGNYPALKSCLIRIPGSLNSKCKAAGIDAEVKIIQRWDGHRPDYRLLLGSFHAYLVGRQPSSRPISSKTLLPLQQYGEEGGKVIPWIEKLLQTPIDDYRKEVIFWILVPYLCTIKDMQDDEIHRVVDEWLDKCEELRGLEPSRRDFARRIDDAIEWARDNDKLPTKLQTIKEDYPDLYKKLMVMREGERGGGEGGGDSSWR